MRFDDDVVDCSLKHIFAALRRWKPNSEEKRRFQVLKEISSTDNAEASLIGE